MKIKKQNGQIVTVHTIGDLFYGYTLLLTTIFIFSITFVFIPTHLGSVVPIVLFLLLLGNTFGKKVVIDKHSESIIVTKRHLMLIRKQTIIPFSKLVRVSSKYRKFAGGSPMESEGYEVNIFTTYRKMGKIRISRRDSNSDAKKDEKTVRDLIGKKMSDLGNEYRCPHCGEIIYQTSLEICPFCHQDLEGFDLNGI